MEWLNNIIANVTIFSRYKIGPGDVMEILIIAFLIYNILLWIKNTRAWSLVKGFVVIIAFWIAASVFRMHTILWITENVLGFAVTVMIVVLQPELRKALEELGKKNLIKSMLPFDTNKRENNEYAEQTVNEITRACAEMSKVKTGALIVIEQEQSLSDYERTGIDVDALVSSQLLINIFEHNTPLHDGAVLIRGNRIVSATCYLPLSDNMNLGKEFGTRHRAGVGISEVTDSLTIIVSEESGKISVAYDGKLERNLDAEGLKNRQLAFVKTQGEEGKKQRIWKKGRGESEK